MTLLEVLSSKLQPNLEAWPFLFDVLENCLEVTGCVPAALSLGGSDKPFFSLAGAAWQQPLCRSQVSATCICLIAGNKTKTPL